MPNNLSKPQVTPAARRDVAAILQTVMLSLQQGRTAGLVAVARQHHATLD